MAALHSISSQKNNVLGSIFLIEPLNLVNLGFMGLGLGQLYFPSFLQIWGVFSGIFLGVGQLWDVSFLLNLGINCQILPAQV